MMRAGTFISPTGEVYVDKKRHFWLVSFMVPLLAVAGPLLYMLSPNDVFLWLFIAFWYLLFPVIDYFMGEDTSNPPESVVPMLEADPYYKFIARINVPVVIGVFIFIAWFVSSYDLSVAGYLGAALTTGYIGGYGLNIGHELGHKKTSTDQWLAKLVLAPAAYGHFFVEHNRGHHKMVATPEDPASSKMGENIYSFAARELPNAIARAAKIEHQRLKDKGLSPYSLKNEFIQTVLMTGAFYVSLALIFGAVVIPFLLIAGFWSMWQLTSANYIEHYGLLRKKLESGRYERPQPHHSWNSNHIFSNWALFHLQRHSDHHANATRAYQSLRHFDDLPSLPNGYFGMFPVAYIPWLWFKVMDKRLIEVVDGDLDRINILPSKRDALIKKYQLKSSYSLNEVAA
ncbi:alkane 1-monooxygenase [Oleiphilus sp. HI0009]|nr:alkane 1-monooxygenase [Oleiphilus sp. HI0009]KZY68745.1 alkane 1-monooxygenase [Oleiphilus sp. HI0066]KZY69825.1 alkane 1-monooxygenase [Oleiphilus sp. HI0067]